MNDMQLILSALHFAAQKHAGQRRKDAAQTPYINHPIAIANLLAECGVTEWDVLCAAILHDTLEDTETFVSELDSYFGVSVSTLVYEVTDDKSLPADERKLLQVEHAPNLSNGAKLIKIADKTCNVMDSSTLSPVGWTLGRKLAYNDWAMRVVNGCRGVNKQLEARFDAAFIVKRDMFSREACQTAIDEERMKGAAA
jgi:GTP diphosphokinase / guanosine-3',5'-bis(diphosphate) 3'-diphosphatase